MKKKVKKKAYNLRLNIEEPFFFKPLFFIDFEYITTSYREKGKRAHLQEIIEIAGIIVTKDGLKKYTEIVKPKCYLENLNKSLGINKITEAELSNGKDLFKAIQNIREYYKPGVTKIISWGSSDLYNINYLCKRQGIQFYIRKDDYIDLSQKFRRFYSLNQAIKLEKALKYLDISDNYIKHRALPDAEMLYRVFDKMVQEGYIDEELIRLTN